MSSFEILAQDKLYEVQQVELNMLRSFVDICENQKLKYYIAYGTLIGAIRHNGFIPWDDDIDIWMPRSDYEVFMNKAQRLLPQYYFVQTNSTDEEYLGGFMKIRDTRTTFIETNYKEKKMNHGIYIDIFPLDFCPDNKLRYYQMLFNRKINLLRTRKEIYVVDEATKHGKISSFIIGVGASALKLITPNICKFARLRENYLKKMSSNKTKNYCNFYSLSSTLVFPTDWFGNGIKWKFEDIEVIVPSDYDSLLKFIYGDYMKLPPKEKQVTRHFTELIDPQKSYMEYCLR